MNYSMFGLLLVAFAGGWVGQANGDDLSCDVAAGERLFKKCAVCHSVEAGVAHGAGPNLYDVVGRAVGKIDGFRFSRAMRESDSIWNAEHLNAFLENPQAVYPRTRMAFSGFKKAEDRSTMICYLRTHSSTE